MKTLLSLLFLTTAGAISAHAHHVDPEISPGVANYCIQELGLPMCSCIEGAISAGVDAKVCRIPVVPVQDFWTNPYSNFTIQAPNITF